MSEIGDIQMLRDTIRALIDAVTGLGNVAAEEHWQFANVRNRALDKAYAALRKTNHHEQEATKSSGSGEK